MKNLKIAHRYAKALFDLAQERKCLEIIHSNLQEISGLISQSKQLADFFEDPVIPFNKQKAILEDLFKKKVDASL